MLIDKRRTVKYNPGVRFKTAAEKEFFSLAVWYLRCRLHVMGGTVFGTEIPAENLEGCLLGMLDQAEELRLICAELRGRSAA